MHRADGGRVAFAGLYEFWRDREIADPDDPQAWLTTFTIITTEAEPGLDRIHDRQPLVLEPEDWAAWLDPAVTDPDEVRTAPGGRRARGASRPTRSARRCRPTGATAHSSSSRPDSTSSTASSTR